MGHEVRVLAGGTAGRLQLGESISVQVIQGLTRFGQHLAALANALVHAGGGAARSIGAANRLAWGWGWWHGVAVAIGGDWNYVGQGRRWGWELIPPGVGNGGKTPPWLRITRLSAGVPVEGRLGRAGIRPL